MATITITISDLPHGHVSVCTDADRPVVGQGVTPAQALAMELLGTAFKRGSDVVYDARRIPCVALAMDLLSPDAYGWAVPPEVARHARSALGSAPKAVEILVINTVEGCSAEEMERLRTLIKPNRGGLARGLPR